MGAGRLLPALAIVALALAAVPASPAIKSVSTESVPYILYPFHSLPVVVVPGGEITVIVRTSEPLEFSEAYLYGLDRVYGLEIRGSTGVYGLAVDVDVTVEAQNLTLGVGAEVEDGLYTLAIVAGGSLLWMPRSVIVDSAGGPRDSVRIFHMSDIHFAAIDRGIPNDFKHARYVALINTLALTLGVDIAVATGDNVDVGTEVDSYKELYRVTNQLLIPSLVVPGNHDWAQVLSKDDLFKLYYGRYLNPFRYWSFVYGSFLFIGLDTKSRGFPDDYQLDFMERALKAHPDKLAIIMFHHPVFREAGVFKGSPESLRRYMYSSWAGDGWEAARRFMQIVEENKNVVAVLSGHIHRDADSVYERRDGSLVYFIATVTANHGTPSGYTWGGKIVEVRSDGSVEVVIPSGREYTRTRGSIPTDSFLVFESVDRYNTAFTWFFNTTGFTEIDVSNVTLVFYLNKSVPLEEYEVYGDEDRILGMEFYDIGIYFLAVAQVNLEGSGRLTIAAYEDLEPPELKIALASKPRMGRPQIINLQVSDEGWGVYRVIAEFRRPDGRVDAVEALRTLEPSIFRVVYKAIDTPGVYEVLIRAVDLNGNEATVSLELTVQAPRETPPGPPTPQPPRTEATPEEATPTQVEAPETEAPATPEETPETPEEAPAPAPGIPASTILFAAVVVAAIIAILLIAATSRR